jgi:hypothetical protein
MNEEVLGLSLIDYEDDDETTAMSLGYDKNDSFTDDEEEEDGTPTQNPQIETEEDDVDNWNDWNEWMEQGDQDQDHEQEIEIETEKEDDDDTSSVTTILSRYKPKILATAIIAAPNLSSSVKNEHNQNLYETLLRTKTNSSKRTFWTKNYKNKKGLVLYVLLSGYFIYCVHMMYYFYVLEKMFMCCCSCYFAAFTLLFLMDKKKFFPYKQRNMSFF